MKKILKTRMGGGHMSLNQQPSGFTPILYFKNFKVFEKKNSPFNPNKKLLAFTLAEVLITLAIIGIVAALTIPVVVQKYKKRVVETQLLKSYNTLFNAIKISEIENGPIENWEYDGHDADVFFNKYIAPYIKTASGSFQRIQLKELGYKDGTKYPDGKNYHGADWVWPAIKINDGTIIFATNVGRISFSGRASSRILYLFDVDINGSKGPNTYAKDIFVYELPATKGYQFSMYGHHSIDVNDDKSLNVSKRTKDDIIKACKDTGKGSNSKYCGAYIMYNGWRIPDDYPYEF